MSDSLKTVVSLGMTCVLSLSSVQSSVGGCAKGEVCDTPRELEQHAPEREPGPMRTDKRITLNVLSTADRGDGTLPIARPTRSA